MPKTCSCYTPFFLPFFFPCAYGPFVTPRFPIVTFLFLALICLTSILLTKYDAFFSGKVNCVLGPHRFRG